MIASLRGKLIYTDHHAAVVECGGVGYKCAASAATLAALPKLGDEVFLYTHMNVGKMLWSCLVLHPLLNWTALKCL